MLTASPENALPPPSLSPPGPWLDEFLTDKARPQLHEANIRLEEDLEPVLVAMHPLLLEQCFVVRFNNALEAVTNHEIRNIRLSVKPSRERRGYVELEIRNTGASYPRRRCSLLRRHSR